MLAWLVLGGGRPLSESHLHHGGARLHQHWAAVHKDLHQFTGRRCGYSADCNTNRSPYYTSVSHWVVLDVIVKKKMYMYICELTVVLELLLSKPPH